jgi:hypothetical protein
MPISRRLAVHGSSTRPLIAFSGGTTFGLPRKATTPQRPLRSAAGVLGGFPRRKSQRKLRSRSIPLPPSSSALLPRAFHSSSPRLHYQRRARGSRARRSWTEQERGESSSRRRPAAPPDLVFPRPSSSGRLIVAAVGVRSSDRRRDAPPQWRGYASPSPFSPVYFTLLLLFKACSIALGTRISAL